MAPEEHPGPARACLPEHAGPPAPQHQKPAELLPSAVVPDLSSLPSFFFFSLSLSFSHPSLKLTQGPMELRHAQASAGARRRRRPAALRRAHPSLRFPVRRPDPMEARAPTRSSRSSMARRLRAPTPPTDAVATRSARSAAKDSPPAPKPCWTSSLLLGSLETAPSAVNPASNRSRSEHTQEQRLVAR